MAEVKRPVEHADGVKTDDRSESEQERSESLLNDTTIQAPAPGEDQPDAEISLKDIENSADKELQMKVNRAIKVFLKLWEGSNQSADLLLDTKKALFPLLVQLRKGNTPHGASHIADDDLFHLQKKEYLKAQQSYMKLSIGNVAWPIGVVGVSIHARSTQTKLEGGQANIMIDEPTRKWITAVKRLITFLESQ